MTVSRKVPIAVIVCAALIVAAGRAIAGPRGFGSIELYGAGGINDNFEDETQAIVSAYNSVGVTASGSTDTNLGIGGRLGTVIHERDGFEVGGSIGAIIGPRIEQTIHNGPFTYIPSGITYNFDGKSEITTTMVFLRALLEMGQTVAIGEGGRLRFAMGAGLATGSVDQAVRHSGSIANVFADTDTDDRWSGFTWEFGPSLIIPMETTELELGIRYAHFPKKKETSEVGKIEWNPLSAFVGVRFGGDVGRQGASSKSAPPYAANIKPEPLTVIPSDQKAREFIITGYANVIQDLSKGSGPHLQSLLDLLAIPEANHAEAIKRIRGLSEAYPNISEFADHVIEVYSNQPSAKPATASQPPVDEKEKMSLEELRKYFKGLPQGTPVKMVELTVDQTWDVVYDRFDGKNFNLIWCCKAGPVCEPGSGNIPIWLWRIRTIIK